MTATFVNWSRQHRASPRRWERPTDEREVCAALDRARANGERVRPIGSGHSWSRAAVPHEVALTLEGMRRIVAIDAVERTITVEGGVTLAQLTTTLSSVGLAMPILGSVSAQTIAGAISTGTHGSSLRYGNLASLVRAMRIAVPGRDGARIEVCGAGSPLLDAARVSMGALGVITEVTLAVTTAFRLIESVEQVSTLRVPSHLEEIANSAPFVKIWWLPGSGPMRVFRYHPTLAAAREPQLLRWLDERVINPFLFEGVVRLSARVPSIVEPVNRWVARSYLDRPRAAVARSDRAFNVAMPPRHHETEYAFGLDDAASVTEQFVRATERARLRIAFPLEIRFVAEDRGWLSPAYGRPTVHIGAYAAPGPDRDRYFETFEQVAQAHHGRPHWGKECRFNGAYLRRVWPEAERFCALRDELDPHRVLGSAAIDGWLDPPRG